MRNDIDEALVCGDFAVHHREETNRCAARHQYGLCRNYSCGRPSKSLLSYFALRVKQHQAIIVGHIRRNHPCHIPVPILWDLRRRRTSADRLTDLRYSPSRPSPRHAVLNASLFVPWKTTANEPLIVELPRRAFQQPNPPPVVLDQVVVGTENGRDATLYPDVRGNGRLDPIDTFRGSVTNFCASRTAAELCPNEFSIEQVIKKRFVQYVRVDFIDKT